MKSARKLGFEYISVIGLYECLWTPPLLENRDGVLQIIETRPSSMIDTFQS